MSHIGFIAISSSCIALDNAQERGGASMNLKGARCPMEGETKTELAA
jgi:hypothetical protein